MSFVEDRLANYIQASLLEGKLGIACSAGIDSMVLLAAACKTYRKEDLVCLHFDHGLREDSQLAAKFIKEYCEKNAIKYTIKTAKAGQINKTELAARQARYDFFERAAEHNALEHILLGHNLNDQAETILFRLFRGTNTAGLQGIPRWREHGPIVIHRPLLDIARIEIIEYAKDNNINFIEDSSNENLDFARNRIRQKILPEALKINPKAIENIVQLSTLVQMEQDYIALDVEKAATNLGPLPWSLELFRTIEPVIQRKLLESFFSPSISFVNDFMAAIREGGFQKINFAKTKFFVIRQKMIHLEVLASTSESSN